MKITGIAIASLSLAALTVSAPAVAEPVYLSCAMMIDGRPVPFNFTTDEEAGTVSIHIVESGATRTVNGTFTPDKVIVDEGGTRWEIDRINLQFSRIITFLNNSTTSGQCRIEAVPERAF